MLLLKVDLPVTAQGRSILIVFGGLTFKEVSSLFMTLKKPIEKKLKIEKRLYKKLSAKALHLTGICIFSFYKAGTIFQTTLSIINDVSKRKEKSIGRSSAFQIMSTM